MPLQTYTDLTTALTNWLQRSDLAALLPNFVQLFEACANRRLRVRQQEAVALLTPSVVLTVTGAANNGAGLIRLTTSGTLAPLGGSFLQGDQATVAGITGTTEANGTWNISTPNGINLDLLASAFVNPYVGGGTVTFTGRASLPADYLAWRQVLWLGRPTRDLGYGHPSVMDSRFPDIPIDPPSEFTIADRTLP